MCYIIFLCLFVIFFSVGFEGCLITNCPRGGKRTEGFRLEEEKSINCVTCGPRHLGRCLGPHICCGPFGCLMGTSETNRCKQQLFLPDVDSCEISGLPCRKNSGKCVSEGICCSHDACYIDKDCANVDNSKHVSDGDPRLNLYNIFAKYQAQIENGEQ